MGELMEVLGMTVTLVFGAFWVVAEEMIFLRIRDRHPVVWERLGRPRVWSLMLTRAQKKFHKFRSDPEALESLNDRVIMALDSVATVSRLLVLLGVLALLGAHVKA
ncbi:hypothetical protein EG19_09420 [Thermoanaerobaculum aquaticum]|jgi:hypothetical protein|uniref:Uncharacterized protein n=1 Tax=Thermoanaerobaculum aquaticum TaxID=1312852 RepID=A0A062XXN4_9BACT|nr:hypothetical protein EG19_09420 [Thermoanaerobaculum aquaticum]